MARSPPWVRKEQGREPRVPSSTSGRRLLRGRRLEAIGHQRRLGGPSPPGPTRGSAGALTQAGKQLAQAIAAAMPDECTKILEDELQQEEAAVGSHSLRSVNGSCQGTL